MTDDDHSSRISTSRPDSGRVSDKTAKELYSEIRKSRHFSEPPVAGEVKRRGDGLALVGVEPGGGQHAAGDGRPAGHVCTPRKRQLIERCQRQFTELIQTGLHQGGAELQKLVDDLPESELRLLLLVALGHQMHHIRSAAGASRN